jgi:DNA-binding MarR family transcriptional regulator
MVLGDYTSRVLADWGEVAPNAVLDGYAVVFRVLRLASIAEERLTSVAAEFGLRAKGDYDTLAVLVRAGGGVTPSELAAKLRVTPAGMTSRLDRLESLGLVARVANPADRRSTSVGATAAGRSVVDAALTRIVATDEELLASLPRSSWGPLATQLEAILTGLGDT